MEEEWKGFEFGLKKKVKNPICCTDSVGHSVLAWTEAATEYIQNALELLPDSVLGSVPPWTEPLDRIGPDLLFCFLFLMYGFVD